MSGPIPRGLGELVCSHGAEPRVMAAEELLLECAVGAPAGRSRPWTTGEIRRAAEIRKRGGRRWLVTASAELLRSPSAVRRELGKHAPARKLRRWPAEVKREAARVEDGYQRAKATRREFMERHDLPMSMMRYLVEQHNTPRSRPDACAAHEDRLLRRVRHAVR